MFYQDEGVDTSLLAAEAGCACTESWNGGNDFSQISFADSLQPFSIALPSFLKVFDIFSSLAVLSFPST